MGLGPPAAFRRQGRDLILAVPRKALGMPPERGPLAFDFKWADNLPDSPDSMGSYGKGDVAPYDRFDDQHAEPAKQAARRGILGRF